MRTIICSITKIADAAGAGLQMVVRTINVRGASVTRGVFGFVRRDYALLLRLLTLQPALQPARLAMPERMHRNGWQGKTTGRSSRPLASCPGDVSRG
jgi:hypothetical protein